MYQISCSIQSTQKSQETAKKRIGIIGSDGRTGEEFSCLRSAFGLKNLSANIISRLDWVYIFYEIRNRRQGNIFLKTTDDQVFVYGPNSDGALGIGHCQSTTDTIILNEYLSGQWIKKIVTGKSHSLALSLDGRVMSWGANLQGQLGRWPRASALPTPGEITLPKHDDRMIKDISCGSTSSAVLTERSTIYVWGSNRYGELGNTCTSDVASICYPPQRIHLDLSLCEPLNEIYAMSYSTFMVRSESGRLIAWGDNSSGRAGVGSQDRIIRDPQFIKHDSRPLEVQELASTGKSISRYAVRDANGDIYVWGKWSKDLSTSPVKVNLHTIPQTAIKQLFSYYHGIGIIGSDGRIWISKGLKNGLTLVLQRVNRSGKGSHPLETILRCCPQDTISIKVQNSGSFAPVHFQMPHLNVPRPSLSPSHSSQGPCSCDASQSRELDFHLPINRHQSPRAAASMDSQYPISHQWEDLTAKLQEARDCDVEFDFSIFRDGRVSDDFKIMAHRKIIIERAPNFLKWIKTRMVCSIG